MGAVMIIKIKERRKALKMSQAELAAKVGVRRETIGHLEKGEYNPSLRLAMDIARALKSGVEELFMFTSADVRETKTKKKLKGKSEQ